MTVYFRPCGDLAQAPAPRGPHDDALFAYLSERTGIAISCDHDAVVDYEDWMEPAAMLAAALRAGLEVKILSRQPLREAILSPLAHVEGKPCRDMLIGRQLRTDPFAIDDFDMGWPAAGTGLANHYAELAAFHRHAGRRVALAHMPGDPEMARPRAPIGLAPEGRPLGEVLLAFSGQSPLVKQVYPAKTLPLVQLHPAPGMNASEAESLFFDEVGFHISRFEGDRNALLVQERIEMTHETRFFVIGREVICGAANIEAHTPQQNPGSAQLMPVFEIRRNSGEILEDREAAAKLIGAAEKIAGEIALECPALEHYVLDLALGADGAPLIVELNPAENAGLYGIDADRLFFAMQAAAEREAHKSLKARPPEDAVAPQEERLTLEVDMPFED